MSFKPPFKTGDIVSNKQTVDAFGMDNLSGMKGADPYSNEEAHFDGSTVNEGVAVWHKEYGIGKLTKIADGMVYVSFSENRNRIFHFPNAFVKGYLLLADANESEENSDGETVAVISDENKLIPTILDNYKRYLVENNLGGDNGEITNAEENYKRDLVKSSAEVLDFEKWTESEIGTGTIGERVDKIVKNSKNNLVEWHQKDLFSKNIKKNMYAAEKVFFELYHDGKEDECFEQIIKLFGKKYDVVSFLYFVADPTRYLPIRPEKFDAVFKELGIDFKTSGHCSWNNYQKYIDVVTKIRDEMREYYKQGGIDLIEAHSLLWTLTGKENKKKLVRNDNGAHGDGLSH